MNQFENLCKLASEESWCWNVNCTTCGHQHFKYAFLELALGKSPADDDWGTSMQNSDIKKSLGEIPRGFTYQQKETLAIICRGADLRIISQNCRRPDWLGYLGLVLYHTRRIPKEYGNRKSPLRNSGIDELKEIEAVKRLSQDWEEQLNGLVGSKPFASTRLCESADDKKKDILTLKDLEAYEYSVMRMPKVTANPWFEYLEHLDNRLDRKNTALDDNNSDRIRVLLKTERVELECIRAEFLKLFKELLGR